MKNVLSGIEKAADRGKKLLTVLIDPDKFDLDTASDLLRKMPFLTTHIFVGGSTAEAEATAACVEAVKAETDLPVILFPGDFTQVTATADAILFLSLLSGRNPEYLIGQQLKSVPLIRASDLEVIPTAYILIDGGKECAVQRVSGTKPLAQHAIAEIVDTALAGLYSGKKMIYLEAGSGALTPVSPEIISAVKQAAKIPLIVGGGIRSSLQLEQAYAAGADIVVIGTAFENNTFDLLKDLSEQKN